ncbi:ABC transporter ATP-binding protein [Gemmatimonas groenlandica]|uniref:ABC transporter ATP-binding protein n=1 Tax=Gemmatimonas groenlandica TaxID=2732249 RepID=A0A6M4IT80_9BACT|nr:ABC transporter ATP-binding protein [Gemmatimonas groenlandica]QJR37860.1 ABC transporter ATP-binding protein [Gemmatimonas groenlandica]
MTTHSRTIALEGRGLTKVFGAGELAVTALHPTDIAVHEGEVLVIMGPSGSGKTTLLSMLGLVLSPSGGEVRLGGDNVTHASADALALIRRQRLGFVFQQFNLLPSLSALENAAVPLLLAGVPRRERLARAADALALVGVSARASHRPRLLSGGQQQRVAIARALVAGAPVLLCDEPTASLDGETGRGILAALRELADRERRAVVIVTHDDRVRAIADRFVHVVDGRVTSDDGSIHHVSSTHSEVQHD